MEFRLFFWEGVVLSRLHSSNAKIVMHNGDLPDGLRFGSVVAIDGEAMGLVPGRDRLCVLQISADDGFCHIVQIPSSPGSVPNLRALCLDSSIMKVFHYARFDVGAIFRTFGFMCENIACTYIMSRLARTYTERHSLKDICRELLSIDISKQAQSSDWGAHDLSAEQKHYAATDVAYLHSIHNILAKILRRESRWTLAEECMKLIPVRVMLDSAGWTEDIFSHH